MVKLSELKAKKKQAPKAEAPKKKSIKNPPKKKYVCEYCGKQFVKIENHKVNCKLNPYVAHIEDVNYDNEQMEKKKTLIKMFRAACNGKNYWKKWFPKIKDYGDFQANFIDLVYKL